MWGYWCLSSGLNKKKASTVKEVSVCLTRANRLGGLVVKASVSGAEDPGFESRLRRDFSGST